MKMPKSCCAADCPSLSIQDPQSHISFHSFPKDRARKKEWVVKVNRFDPKTKKLWEPKSFHKLCSLHFEESCFTFKTRFCRENGLNCAPVLEEFAVPTLFSYNEESRKRLAMLSERRSAYSRRRAQKQMLEELLAAQEEHDQAKETYTVDVPVECVHVTLTAATPVAPTAVSPTPVLLTQVSPTPVPTPVLLTSIPPIPVLLAPVSPTAVLPTAVSPTPVPPTTGMYLQTCLNPPQQVSGSEMKEETCALLQTSSKPDAKKKSSFSQKYNRPRIPERIRVRISPNHPYKDVIFYGPSSEEFDREQDSVSRTETAVEASSSCVDLYQKNCFDEREKCQKWLSANSMHLEEIWCDCEVKPDIDGDWEKECFVKNSGRDAHVELQETCEVSRVAVTEHTTLAQRPHQDASEKEAVSCLGMDVAVEDTLWQLKYKRGIQTRGTSEHSQLSKAGIQTQPLRHVNCDFVKKEFEHLGTAWISAAVTCGGDPSCENKIDSEVYPTGLYPAVTCGSDPSCENKIDSEVYPTGLYPAVTCGSDPSCENKINSEVYPTGLYPAVTCGRDPNCENKIDSEVYPTGLYPAVMCGGDPNCENKIDSEVYPTGLYPAVTCGGDPNCENKIDSEVYPTGLYPAVTCAGDSNCENKTDGEVYPTGLYPNLHYIELRKKLCSPTSGCTKVISDISNISLLR